MPEAPVVAPMGALPRVTIKYCTQCKWLLRAAYFAQELLSTFSTSLGEVALQPATGGVFTVTIVTAPASPPSSSSPSSGAAAAAAATTTSRVLWDRKADGGFPETKELKRRVRDVIDPGRDLGHVDRDHRKDKAEGRVGTEADAEAPAPVPVPTACAVERGGGGGGGDECEDCQ
ncbi:uncharacterized protein E0L32_008996 [Thyridium curvatum]|uniref:Uncharacterized protein n=1 Tax=Thyridium curvatum TaxID=1093900 RepID=A0A507AI77_9PEZI|nr:uncharacterized protein E0L32_008996 [Thyridium curvatum]TPX09805.1 hypothetical protein E0L32_008996 [Thyridium curvatum]